MAWGPPSNAHDAGGNPGRFVNSCSDFSYRSTGRRCRGTPIAGHSISRPVGDVVAIEDRAVGRAGLQASEGPAGATSRSTPSLATGSPMIRFGIVCGEGLSSTGRGSARSAGTAVTGQPSGFLSPIACRCGQPGGADRLRVGQAIAARIRTGSHPVTFPPTTGLARCEWWVEQAQAGHWA